MREKLLKTDTLIEDKLTGEKLLVGGINPNGFRVMPVTDEEIALILNKSININDVWKETGQEGCKSSRDISRKDLILYRFLKDVRPAKRPDDHGYGIDNDGFIIRTAPTPWDKDERLAEQGERRFKKFLGTCPNSLILVDRDDNLVLYNIRKDMFKTLLEPGKNDSEEVKYIQVEQAREFVAFAVVYERAVEEDAQGNPVEVTRFKRSYLIIEENGWICASRFIGDNSGKDAEISHIIVSEDDNLLVVYTEKDQATGEEKEMTRVLFGGSRLIVSGFAIFAKEVNNFATIRKKDGTTLIIHMGSGNETTFNIPELRDFFAFEQDGEDLYLVNKLRNIKKLTATKTFDRGTIYTVEDVNAPTSFSADKPASPADIADEIPFPE